MSDQLTEIQETSRTLIKDYIIIHMVQVPMYDPGESEGYTSKHVVVATTADGLLTIFNPVGHLIAAACFNPAMLIKGPAYNQLTIDRIFSWCNFMFAQTQLVRTAEMSQTMERKITALEDTNIKLEREITTERQTARITEHNLIELHKKTLWQLEKRDAEIQQLQEELEKLKLSASANNMEYSNPQHWEFDL